MFLWKKLQQLFEHFCVKLSTVPALNHDDELLVFAERREKKNEKGERTDQEMAKWLSHHLNCFRKMFKFMLFLGSMKVIWKVSWKRLIHMSTHGTAAIYLNARVDLAHLFGHLLDGSGDFLVLVLGHRQTEELLDAAVVRLRRRRLLLDGRPQGLTVRVCTWRGKKMVEIIQM